MCVATHLKTTTRCCTPLPEVRRSGRPFEIIFVAAGGTFPHKMLWCWPTGGITLRCASHPWPASMVRWPWCGTPERRKRTKNSHGITQRPVRVCDVCVYILCPWAEIVLHQNRYNNFVVRHTAVITDCSVQLSTDVACLWNGWHVGDTSARTEFAGNIARRRPDSIPQRHAPDARNHALERASNAQTGFQCFLRLAGLEHMISGNASVQYASNKPRKLPSYRRHGSKGREGRDYFRMLLHQNREHE